LGDPLPPLRRERLRATALVLAKFAGDAGYRIEQRFVEAVEVLRRVRYRLDRRLYSERRRIRSVTEGARRHGSNKFAVFVVHAPSGLPQFTLNFIAALDRASYNVVLVSNAKLDEAQKAALLRDCRILIERENFGRDFGGYKDGIAHTLRRFPHIERLIIANDSLYYLEPGLDRLTADLDGPEDFIGVSEVFENRYHVASFLLSFGPRVLADPAFREFWAGYRPINTRMWAVMQGECELSRRLMAAGHRPRVLFRAEALRAKLKDLGVSGLAEIGLLFPPAIRALLPPLGEPSSAAAPAQAFGAAVTEQVMARNQMHAAGFAFMKFVGMPVFKRDIVYRGLFPHEEASRVVKRLGLPMQAEIVADLARRRPPRRLDLLRRLLYRHGFI